MAKSKKASDKDLTSKLQSSSAMQSLTMEQGVVAQLRKLKWAGIHSCYYTDLQDRKLREIDVVGKKLWKRKIRGIEQILILHLVVECKSVKGYHILLSTESMPLFRELTHFAWVGDEENRHRVTQIFSSARLPDQDKGKLAGTFGELAYPHGYSTVNKLIVDALRPPFRASAFRETNIGSEKELDASVLWRAGLALSSAVSSFKEQYLTTSLDWIDLAAKFATYDKPEKAKFEILKMCLSQVNHVALYHPVVVIDSMLWATQPDKPKQIKWCRIEENDVTGSRNWWFDLVYLGAFHEYVAKLTAYYNSKLSRVSAKLDNHAFDINF